MSVVNEVGGQALEFVRALKAVGATKWQPPSVGKLGQLNTPLPPVLQEAIEALGYGLYEHQVEAIEALRQGDDLALTLPTAAGKSLCYSLPMLEAIVEARSPEGSGQPAFRGLLVVPQRALATDQEAKLGQWVKQLRAVGTDINVIKITGDVQGDRLRLFRQVPDLIIISPECLHFLLRKVRDPKYAGFGAFLRELRFVVVDEVQAFDGVLGANFVNVLKRLRLGVLRAGGTLAQIQYVLSSATMANPQQIWAQFSDRLGHHPMQVIKNSTAPFPGRLTVATNGRISSRAKLSQLALKVARSGQTVLVFVNSRPLGRRLLTVVHRDLARLGLRYSSAVFFHGTLSAAKRQAITDQIRAGTVKIIITTSALESGVDFPQIDWAIAWGYPGNDSLIQRFGRAGRGTTPGVAVFVPAMYRILDQQIAKEPDLMESGGDGLFLNPDYPKRLEAHLMAAAWECGIRYQDELGQLFGDAGIAAALRLVDAGKLVVRNGYLRAETETHRNIVLRGQKMGTVTLINTDGDQPIEDFSHTLALRELYPGAIYSAQEDGASRKYRVLSLDREAGQAFCEEMTGDSSLITNPVAEGFIGADESVAVESKVVDCGGGAELLVSLGWGRVVQQIFGYEESLVLTSLSCQNATCAAFNVTVGAMRSQCQHCGSELVGAEQISMVKEVAFSEPLSEEYETAVISISANSLLQARLSRIAREMMMRQRLSAKDYGILSAQNATVLGLHTLVHLAMSSLQVRSRELAAQDMISSDEDGETQIELFDSANGGTGTCEYVFNNFQELMPTAYHIGAECYCDDQCPRCTSHIECASNNVALYRPLGAALLEGIVNR